MLSGLHEVIRQRRNREKLYSTAAYWDSKANSYNETAVSMWPNRALNGLYESEQKELIISHLGDVSGIALLDLGCGTGRFSRWFAVQGSQVTGVDFSAGALNIAALQYPSDNPSYRQGSVFELTDEDTYDLVFTWGVLTIACRDKDQLLDSLIRIRRALRADGRLLLTEPIHRGVLHRVLNLDLSEFLAVMREAGFEVQATTPLHFWPMRLALCYISWPAWMTVPLYHLGQAAMKIPGLSRLGDYWAILACPLSPLSSNNPSDKEGM
jgi:2-polyprenyl-3-methyl-5-hydroxy-6-metoxy-1,4-benzoquinol methylase